MKTIKHYNETPYEMKESDEKVSSSTFSKLHDIFGSTLPIRLDNEFAESL